MSSESEGRHALVVATARYSDAKLQQLRAPAADAELLAAVLRDPAKGDFEVEVLLDESHSRLTRRIASFFRDRRPQDLLLLHFSCHGVKDDRGELYLAAADTELDLLSATGVAAAWLNDQISRTRARRTVVLLDCCFSGSFPFGLRPRGSDVDAPGQFQGRGRAIITASNAMEYAYEGDELRGEGQPSVFTEAVVEGLATGKADLDRDRLVSVDDLYNYVYDRVKERAPSQTPSKKSELEGPIYLAKSAYRPEVKPARLDSDLLERTEDRYAGIRQGAVQELAMLLSSRDPAVALAARLALSRMIDDDSRRVSVSARAALADAERDERGRPEIEDGENGRDEGTEESTVSEGAVASEGKETGSTPAERARTDGSAPARGRAATASWLRRHSRLAIPAVIIAIVGVAAILFWPGAGDDRDSAPASAAIPDANPCERDKNGWTIEALGADRHYECELTTSPPPDGLEGGSLAYALFSSAREARNAFDTGLDGEYDEGSSLCRPSAARAIRAVYRRGQATCLVADEWVGIWWNDDRSRVLGMVDFAPSTSLEDLIEAWRRVISSN